MTNQDYEAAAHYWEEKDAAGVKLEREKLRAMVKETGAVSTDYESPEAADTLCDRTTPYAENWKPTADRLWEESGHSCASCAGCGQGK